MLIHKLVQGQVERYGARLSDTDIYLKEATTQFLQPAIWALAHMGPGPIWALGPYKVSGNAYKVSGNAYKVSGNASNF